MGQMIVPLVEEGGNTNALTVNMVIHFAWVKEVKLFKSMLSKSVDHLLHFNVKNMGTYELQSTGCFIPVLIALS